MNNMYHVFDHDYIKINSLTFKYSVLSIIIILILSFLLLIIKKERFYINIISFYSNKSAYIVVDEKYLNDIKETRKIILNDVSYDYNVEKIEKSKEMYLVYITFSIDLENLNVNNYKILIEKESIIKYISRIVKGE